MANPFRFLRPQALTKRVIGWQAYQSYLVAETVAERAHVLQGACAIVATSWTTLEAALLLGRRQQVPVYWVPLANRAAVRSGVPQFVSANRARGRRNFASLARRLRPWLESVDGVYCIDKHPDSPGRGVLLQAGVPPARITTVTTLNNLQRDEALAGLDGEVLVLADTPVVPGGGIQRFVARLLARVPGVHLVLLSAAPPDRGQAPFAGNAAARTTHLATAAHDDAYGWPALARFVAGGGGIAAAIGSGAPRVPAVAGSGWFARWRSRQEQRDRRLIDALRRRNGLVLLQLYFLLRGSHPLEDEIRTFRRNLVAVAHGDRFDIVQSIDLISAPAGADLADSTGARHIVDVNEFPYLETRVGWQFRTMLPLHFRRLYRQFGDALGSSAGVISNSVGGARLTRHKFGHPALPVRNLRNPVAVGQGGAMRREFGIPDDAVVLVHVCTISASYKSDIAVRLLCDLPANYHLVFVGEADTPRYGQEVRALVGELGLAGRVHFHGEIAGEKKYITYVADADIGIVTLDSDSPFVRFNLPNRICDLLAAGLPMVSSFSYEVKHIFDRTGTGVVVKGNEPAVFAREIRAMQARLGTGLRQAARDVAGQYTWDAEMSAYFRQVYSLRRREDVREVAFVFQRGLVRNRRVLRFADEYRARGHRVTIFCGTLPPKPVREANPDIRFVRASPRQLQEN